MALNWSITSSDVVSTVLRSRQGESLTRLGEACALVEQTCSDPAYPLSSLVRVLAYNVGAELALQGLDSEAIAAAMLNLLPGPARTATQHHYDAVHGILASGMAQSLLHGLRQFSSLEWNTWPAVSNALDSVRADEVLKRSYTFAVGPVTIEDRQSLFFAGTKQRTRERQVPNLVNLLAAACSDRRVASVKLAERLCLTRMLSRPDVRTAVPIDATAYARVNLAVYAALAERRATWHLKSALEDASLALLDPVGYLEIAEALRAHETQRAEALTRVIATVEQCLLDHDIISARVEGRTKHIFSIYRKMKSKGQSVDQMIDLLAVRVIIEPVQSQQATELEARVAETAAAKAAADARLRDMAETYRMRSDLVRRERAHAKEAAQAAGRAHSRALKEFREAVDQTVTAAIDMCYGAYAVLRAQWNPVRDQYGTYDMRDWISRPKPNGYQSIHTAMLIDGMTVEVQIRTQRMHEQAEFGSASHAVYKSEKNYGGIQPKVTVS